MADLKEIAFSKSTTRSMLIPRIVNVSFYIIQFSGFSYRFDVCIIRKILIIKFYFSSKTVPPLDIQARRLSKLANLWKICIDRAQILHMDFWQTGFSHQFCAYWIRQNAYRRDFWRLQNFCRRRSGMTINLFKEKCFFFEIWFFFDRF